MSTKCFIFCLIFTKFDYSFLLIQSYKIKYLIIFTILCVIVCLGPPFNSALAISDFRCLLITFANSLDPDQYQQNVVLIWIQTISHSGSLPDRAL